MSSLILDALNHNDNFILQVPHHGSWDNWETIIRNNITAKVYVIPFGYGNKPRHPNAKTIDDMMKNDKEFYCVTQSDNFIYYID